MRAPITPIRLRSGERDLLERLAAMRGSTMADTMRAGLRLLAEREAGGDVLPVKNERGGTVYDASATTF